MKEKGLSLKEARIRLQKYGKNEIKKKKKISPVKLFLSQFTSPIILLLIGAALLSLGVNFFKHENYFDSILIFVIVGIAGVASFFQEYKAEKIIEALQEMASPSAKVIRNGMEMIISSLEVVPGDLIVVEGGDIVPADAKIISGNLEVNESILTGESKAKKKEIDDKIFYGCEVYSGKCIAKVFATGMKTEIGKIAGRVQKIEKESASFKKQIDNFSKKIIWIILAIIILTFALAFKKFGFIEAGLLAVSLAVAAIPEDLPAVITVSLSMGARIMAKKNALVRRLSTIESIGSVNVICTDKTGTLTTGEMKVDGLWYLKESEKARKLAKECCYYCNDAEKISENNKTKWVGDETDIALKKFGLSSAKKGEKIEEIPFSSERKMMSVAYKFGNEKIIFTKGAPEVVIKKCSSYFSDGKVSRIDSNIREKVLKENKKLASQGYRVLALAFKKYRKPLDEGLTFIGLVILLDPPRKEVRESIQECYSAGIRVIIITGDNPLTAKTVAKKVGVETKGVLTGDTLDKISDKKLKKYLDEGYNIFARTNPFHKLRILNILKKEGNSVAMTGDGVNDALALKKAEVGIAMGSGTEVAKEASDIILLDNNFASIKNAVREGRRIFNNIRKFIDYLLTCNLAEVIVILAAVVMFPFLSLFPIQILWINLITDGIPALALAVDPPRPDIMKKKPRKRNEGIVNKKVWWLIFGIGIKKSLLILGTFLFMLLVLKAPIDKARSVLLTAFIMYEFIRIAIIRYSENFRSLKDWFANKFLNYALLISLLLQILLLYTPVAEYFKVVPLNFIDWIVLFGGTVLGFILGISIAWGIDKVVKEEY